MPSHRRSRLPVLALAALMVAPPVAIFASIPWLRQQPDEIGVLLSGIAATLTIVASLLLAVIHDRRQDEWHRSATRFSSQWGWTGGACLVALLLAVPPARDLIVSCVAMFADGPKPDQELVILTFTFGFMAVVIAQLACTALLSVGWSFWMSRSAREPHEE